MHCLHAFSSVLARFYLDMLCQICVDMTLSANERLLLMLRLALGRLKIQLSFPGL